MIQNIKKFLSKAMFWAQAIILWVITSAITYSGGLVTFDASDEAVVDTWISNALNNFWAWVTFVLPYVWVFAWVLLLVAIAMRLSSRFWR